MLTTFIAIFEQICTCNEASATDYDNDGNPIYSKVVLSTDQQNKLDLIQSECLRFTRDAQSLCQAIPVSHSMLRDTAAASLFRFIFFLTQPEREYLQKFKFELNLGTTDVLDLIDVDKSIANLRRQSWLFSLKDNSKAKRMNYPAEWRAISYNLVLGLIAERRFGIKIALSDLSHRRVPLEIIVSNGQQYFNLNLEAIPTHDGFFSLLVPVVDNQCEIGICFGQKYKWIEFECAELIRFEFLNTPDEAKYTEDASPHLTVRQISDKGAGLFECESDTSMLIFLPNAIQSKLKDTTYILRVVFRGIGAS